MENGRYRHVIWDWNGTLVNDLWLSHQIVSDYLEKKGFQTFSVEKYRELFCHPIRLFYEKIGLSLTAHEFSELAGYFLSSYQEQFAACELHDQARPFLMQLREDGISHSLLSAHPHELLLENLETISLQQAFDQIFGLDNRLGDSKLQRGQALLASLDYDRSLILMIGDTDHDYEVAKDLGIQCVLISNGYQTHQHLRQFKTPLFTSLAEFARSGFVQAVAC